MRRRQVCYCVCCSRVSQDLRHSNKTRLEYKEPLRGTVLTVLSASLGMTNPVLLEELNTAAVVALFWIPAFAGITKGSGNDKWLIARERVYV